MKRTTQKKSSFAPWAEPPKGVLVEGNLLLIENEGGHFLIGRFLREDEKYLNCLSPFLTLGLNPVSPVSRIPFTKQKVKGNLCPNLNLKWIFGNLFYPRLLALLLLCCLATLAKNMECR